MALPYATIDDIFKRYKPIGSMVGAGSLDVTSDDVSSVFIADAESFINAHIAVRYEVPVTAEPLITQMASDLAISNMIFEKHGAIPDFIQGRYDRALGYLDKLAEGKMLLVGSGTTQVSTGDSEAWSSTGSFHPIFHPALDPLDQAADRDYIDQGRDERSGDGPLGSDDCI